MAYGDKHLVDNEEDLNNDDDYKKTLDPSPNVIDEEDNDVNNDVSTTSSNLNFGTPDSFIYSSLPSSSSKLAPKDVTISVYGVSRDPFHPNRQWIEDVIVFNESRKLSQRLWTDKDEIELLKGFLEYTAQHGATYMSHHHHLDMKSFYDKINNKFHMNFNKNQLVEKLRRLKKKYHNVASKIIPGKEYIFKSAHNREIFEISHKIWNNVDSVACGGLLGSTTTMENDMYEDDEANPNQLLNFPVRIPNPTQDKIEQKTPRSRKWLRATATPRMKKIQGFSQLPNQPSGFTNVVTPNTHTNVSSMIMEPPFKAVTLTPVVTLSPVTPLTTTTTSMLSLIEETMKSYLSPILKELIYMNRWRGLGLSTTLATMPFGFRGDALSPKMMADNKWRRQQMLELEVFSRRLELVQDQIKAELEQLKSM